MVDSSWIVHDVAGSGLGGGDTGNGGPAANAGLNEPTFLAADGSSDLSEASQTCWC